MSNNFFLGLLSEILRIGLNVQLFIYIGLILRRLTCSAQSVGGAGKILPTLKKGRFSHDTTYAYFNKNLNVNDLGLSQIFIGIFTLIKVVNFSPLSHIAVIYRGG